MTTRLTNVVFDAAGPGALAHWWSEAIGWPVTYIAPDEVVVEPPGNAQSFDVPKLVFVPVDDPKTVKNRVHLDLGSDSVEHQAALVERLVGLGATHT
ncbi:MAG: VOC family protein, partial [Candidatus Limnocylindrales bacterium]